MVSDADTFAEATAQAEEVLILVVMEYGLGRSKTRFLG